VGKECSDMRLTIEWWPALVAFAVTMLAMWVLVRIAPRIGLLDEPEAGPDARKRHAVPTPVVGGLAMLLACLAASPLTLPLSRHLVGLGVASLIVVVIGVYDDRHDVRWYWRLGWQMVAGLVIALWGGARIEELGAAFGLASLNLGLWSIPFTVFATVGLINAMNMIDGADGLAGSLGLAALVMLCAASIYAGNDRLAERVLIVCGALAAFLWWNLRFPGRARARAFMGDAGSGFLGLVIAWVAFRLTQNDGHPVNPVLALWLLPIPVMDCLVLIVRRLKEGRSPFSAGNDHIHHLMAEAGFRPMQVVGLLVVFSLVTGLVAGQAMRLDVPHPVLLSLYLLLCAGWYLLTRRRERAVAFFRRLRGASAVQAQADTVGARSVPGVD
jgi:UDP-GlcNAc:undecaprenyl-phosphate GlcNAc-1-phosphate transferase